MPQSILYLPFVVAAVRPFVCPFTCYPIISKLSLVNNSICPNEPSLAIEQPIVKLSFVSISILEGNFSWPIQALSIDLAILRTGGDLPFPILVEDLGELNGEHHAIIHIIDVLSYIIKLQTTI